MVDFSQSAFVVNDEASLSEAMRLITLNHRGTAIVVKTSGQVVGVISDGDIRRALVRGAIMETPVSRCLNSNFISLLAGDETKVEEFWAKHPEINVVPVVTKQNVLVDILVRGGDRES